MFNRSVTMAQTALIISDRVRTQCYEETMTNNSTAMFTQKQKLLQKALHGQFEYATSMLCESLLYLASYKYSHIHDENDGQAAGNSIHFSIQDRMEYLSQVKTIIETTLQEQQQEQEQSSPQFQSQMVRLLAHATIVQDTLINTNSNNQNVVVSDDSISLLKKAMIELDPSPSNVDTIRDLAKCYEYTGRIDAAELCYRYLLQQLNHGNSNTINRQNALLEIARLALLYKSKGKGEIF